MRKGRPTTLWFGMGLLGLCLLVCQVRLNLQLRSMGISWVEPPDEQGGRWSPELARIFSFGHLPVLIDWIWIQSLIDPAISHVTKGAHPAVYYGIDLITELDPAFFDAYYAGGNLLAVVRNDGEGAKNILLKGDEFRKKKLPEYSEAFRAAHWGSSWNIPLLLAYTYLFELNDLPHAAIAFQEASEVPHSPPYLDRLAKRLERPGGQFEVGIRLLNFLITTTSDLRVREEFRVKRNSLFLSQFLFDLNMGFESYLKKLPQYRSNVDVSAAEIQKLWRRYSHETKIPTKDPFGGRIELDEKGKVTSTTPRIEVFGLK